jgi:hypothetical protein
MLILMILFSLKSSLFIISDVATKQAMNDDKQSELIHLLKSRVHLDQKISNVLSIFFEELTLANRNM